MRLSRVDCAPNLTRGTFFDPLWKYVNPFMRWVVKVYLALKREDGLGDMKAKWHYSGIQYLFRVI